MAAAVAIGDFWADGARDNRAVSVTFDASYPTGGLPVTLAQLRLNNSVTHIGHGIARDGSGNAYHVQWNGSVRSPKLIVSRTNAINGPLQEVPNATDLSAFTSRHIVIGK